MPNPRLAARYAKSLIGFAIEKGELEKVYADMQWLHAVCKTNPDLVALLRSPVINSDTKKKILEKVTAAGQVGEITTGFNRLLITKGRESNLPEITGAFIAQYKEYKNIHTIKLTTVSPVSDTVRKAIIDQIKKTAGYEKVELEEKVNPDLVGGFILQIGDKLIDASIAYDLKNIARQFDNNDFIFKIR